MRLRAPTGPGCSRASAPELAIKLHAVLLQSGKVAEAEQFAVTG